MKTLLTTLVVTLFSVNLFAAIPAEITDNESSKLMKMINEADINDWETYTTAAELSINWNADLELAKEWIDHAITIDSNHKTLEVLGDYYLRNGNIEKAYATYEKALLTNITTIDKNSRASLQRKLLVFSKELK